jgi:hypothetical protein
MTLLCKKIIVAKFKEVKTGCILAESSKKGYGSKRSVFPMMMMMMMMMIMTTMMKTTTTTTVMMVTTTTMMATTTTTTTRSNYNY